MYALRSTLLALLMVLPAAARAAEGGDPSEALAPLAPAEASAPIEGLSSATEPNGGEVAAPTRYTGRMVSQRSLEAPRGGLPQESLEPLLRVRQDVPYNPQDVRRDIALLYQVAGFAQVEVDVEESVTFDADGNPVPAVGVTYRVFPPPRLTQIEVVGNRHLSKRSVLGALGLERSDPWYPEAALDHTRKLEAAYAREGWPGARVTLTATRPDAESQVSLTVEVAEGPPRLLDDVRVRNTVSLSAARIRWILGRHGLRPGRVYTDQAMNAAREQIADAARRRGWYEARATVEVGTVVDDADPTPKRRLVVIVDPGRACTLTRAGGDLPRTRAISRSLELDRGLRLTRSWAEDASHTLTAAMQKEGYLAAAATVTVEETRGRVAIQVDGARGPLHRMGALQFVGTEGLTDRVWSARYLKGAFREAAQEAMPGRGVTEAGVDHALVAMQDFYRAQGYLSARLTRSAFSVRPEGRVARVAVDIAVDPGPQAVLTGVTVNRDEHTTFDEALPGEEMDVYTPFDNLIGKPVNPAEIEVRTRKLVDTYAEHGYLAADAHTSLQVSPDGTQATASIAVHPGPLVYLRSIVIRGYRRTRRFVIEREINLVPGDPLAPSRIAEIRRGLYDLGVFDHVDIDTTGDEDRSKDVIVTVTEKRNLHFETGGGIATDQGARLFLRAGHRNLFGLGHRLTTYGQVGVGWVGSSWIPDWAEPEWRAAARYEAPHVPTRGERLGIDVLFREEEQEPQYRMRQSGGGLGLVLKLGPNGTAEFGYKFAFRQLLDVDPGVLVAGDPWLDELSVRDLTDPSPMVPSDIRRQSGLSLSFVFDRRDDPFAPRHGVVGTLKIDLADRVLTDVSYLRGEGGATGYVPLGSLLGVFRARGGLALLPEPDTTLPLEERFRLGGGASFRGFALDSIGPANEVSQESIDFPDAVQPLIDYAGRNASARWIPTGGDAMAVASAEVWIPFERLGMPSLTGTNLAVFLDVGNVYFLSGNAQPDSALQGLDPALRYAIGVGLRRSTPVGPVQVDLGWNPNPLGFRGETGWPKLDLSVGAL